MLGGFFFTSSMSHILKWNTQSNINENRWVYCNFAYCVCSKCAHDWGLPSCMWVKLLLHSQQQQQCLQKPELDLQGKQMSLFQRRMMPGEVIRTLISCILLPSSIQRAFSADPPVVLTQLKPFWRCILQGAGDWMAQGMEQLQPALRGLASLHHKQEWKGMPCLCMFTFQ